MSTKKPSNPFLKTVNKSVNNSSKSGSDSARQELPVILEDPPVNNINEKVNNLNLNPKQIYQAIVQKSKNTSSDKVSSYKTEEQIAESYAKENFADLFSDDDDDDDHDGGDEYDVDDEDMNDCGEYDEGESIMMTDISPRAIDDVLITSSVSKSIQDIDTQNAFKIDGIPDTSKFYINTNISKSKTIEYYKMVNGVGYNTQMAEYFDAAKHADVNKMSSLEMIQPNAVFAKDTSLNTVFHVCSEVPNKPSLYNALGCSIDRSVFSNIFYTSDTSQSTADHNSNITNLNLKRDTALSILYKAMGRTNNQDLPLLLKSGWLYKYKDGHAPKKRWCRLYDTHLLYFEKQTDAQLGIQPKGSVPLHGCLIKQYPYLGNDNTTGNTNADDSSTLHNKISRASTIQKSSSHTTNNNVISTKIPTTTFEILISADMTESKKKTFFGGLMGRISKTEQMKFQAVTEMESLEWITLLTAITGNIEVIDISARHRQFYNNLDARRIVLQQGNQKGETPLHIMVINNINNQPTITDDKKVDIIECIHWLISNGCDPNQSRRDGATPTETAYNEDNNEIEKWINEITKKLDREEEIFENLQFPLLCPPIRFPGYSYITLHFHKQSYTDQARYVCNY